MKHPPGQTKIRAAIASLQGALDELANNGAPKSLQDSTRRQLVALRRLDSRQAFVNWRAHEWWTKRRKKRS